MEPNVGGAAPTAWPSLPDSVSLQQVVTVISESTKLPIEALVPGATMESLNIASLDIVDILFELEERYGVYIPMDDQISNVTYLADLVGVVGRLIEEEAAKA